MNKIIYHYHAIYTGGHGNQLMFDGIFSWSHQIETTKDYNTLKKTILSINKLTPSIDRIQIVSLSRL